MTSVLAAVPTRSTSHRGQLNNIQTYQNTEFIMFKCAHKSPLIIAPKVQFVAKYSAKMHCPFWNISNSVTVRLFFHLFAHISFFNKDEHQPHEFISVASFASHQLSQKYWLYFQPWMPAFDMIVGPWPMKNWLTSSILIIEMWHRFITEVVYFSEVDTSLALHWSGTPLDLTLTQTLSHFINKFYWELTSWEVDLVGVDFIGNWSGGSWFHGWSRGHELLFCPL